MERQERGGGRRCAAVGCGRFVEPGRAVCRDHRGTPAGRDVGKVARRAALDALAAVGDEGRRGVGGARDQRAARREEAAEVFRRRVEHGRYRGLFDAATGRILAEAADEGGLRDELGALRYALARLLAEEEDARHLAHGVARLASAAERVARAQHAMGGGTQGELAALLERVLEEVNGEEVARREVELAGEWEE